MKTPSQSISISCLVLACLLLNTSQVRAVCAGFAKLDEQLHSSGSYVSVLANDPGPGGLPNALTYQLQALLPGVVPGDVLITESNSAALSDLIRFNPDGTVVFYSDMDEPPSERAPADIGFPTQFYSNNISIAEVGPEGSNGVNYIPGPGEPGHIATCPSFAYVITSDIPSNPPVVFSCEALKFYQVPMNNGAPVIPSGGIITAGSTPTPFPGHDEVSTAYFSPGNNSYSGQYMADDFCDHLSTPIVHVTWWGSYITNYYGAGVQQFLIAFETDVASNAPNNDLGYSHPGTVIISQIVTKGPLAPRSGTFVEAPIAIGPTGPANPDGNLYQYDAELAIPAPEFSNQVEWIKIVALTNDRQLSWGWHDRDYGIPNPLACTAPSVSPGEFNENPSPSPTVWHFQDDAVTGPVSIILSGGTNVVQGSYARTFYLPPYDGVNFSKDLAFALYTTVAANITVDEDGKGSTNGLPITGIVANDPGPGGQPQALTYPLPFFGTVGDVILIESPAGGPPGDILRFNGNGTVVFYSQPFTVDTNNCPDSLADGSGPGTIYSNQVLLTEVSLGGGTNGLVYSPALGQPGWDCSYPTYTFLSDYPPLAADPFTAWQLKYFGCTVCAQALPTADPDGDGMNNGNEFLSGTDPTNGLSYFHITSVTRQGIGSNDINIAWSARPCKVYVVQVFPGHAPDGSYSNSFTDIATSLTIGGVSNGVFLKGDSITNYVDVGAATNKPARYYRVRLVP